MTPRIAKVAAAISTAIFVSACAPGAYTVQDPTPSEYQYVKPLKREATLAVSDNRKGEEAVFHTGVLQSSLQNNGAEIVPVDYLVKHTQAELRARGLPVTINHGETGEITLNSFKMRNHRTNGYTPYISFTSVSADVKTPEGPVRIAGWITRGKVPVWSFEEIVEPTINQPMSLIIKEFAAKLNRTLYGHKASDAAVDELIEKTSGKPTRSSFLDVYELGFTNNKRAIPHLLKLVKSDEQDTRAAAISSLGTLGDTQQFELLKKIAESGDWRDKAVAYKSIGDLGTPAAKAYLKSARKQHASESAKESVWLVSVLGLYE